MAAVAFYDAGMPELGDAIFHLLSHLQNPNGTIFKAIGGVGNGGPATQTDLSTAIEAATFAGLADVSVSNPTNGQVPTWQGGVLVNQTPATASGSAAPDPGKCHVRVSLSSTQPVTTGNVSGTKLYCHPRNGNRASTWNGSSWAENSLSAVLSASVPASSNIPFDLTLHKSGTTLKLSTTVWASSATRATPVRYQDGVAILSGTTKRLLASGYVSASGHCVLNSTKLNLVNVYNRMPYKLVATDPTNSWTSSNDSFHPWHSGTDNRVHFVVPLPDEYEVDAEFLATGTGDTAGSIGIGIDSTSVDSSDIRTDGNSVSSEYVNMTARYAAYQAVGKHYLQPLEKASPLSTSFLGDNGGQTRAGMVVKMAA